MACARRRRWMQGRLGRGEESRMEDAFLAVSKAWLYALVRDRVRGENDSSERRNIDIRIGFVRASLKLSE